MTAFIIPDTNNCHSGLDPESLRLNKAKTKIMQKHFFVYIMTNKKQGTLYTGVTNDLLRRVFEHKEGKLKGFTNKYKLNKLVYYDVSCDVTAAIAREKQLKNWKRQWKIALIEELNPNWNDLYQRLLDGE